MPLYPTTFIYISLFPSPRSRDSRTVDIALTYSFHTRVHTPTRLQDGETDILALDACARTVGAFTLQALRLRDVRRVRCVMFFQASTPMHAGSPARAALFILPAPRGSTQVVCRFCTFSLCCIAASAHAVPSCLVLYGAALALHLVSSRGLAPVLCSAIFPSFPPN